MAAERGRRRRLSLRWRIVLVATAAVAVALAVGSAAFVGVLRESLVAGVQLTAERDAAELVGQVETTGVTSVDTDADDDDEQIVQLVAADGSLVAASDNADDGPLLSLPQLQRTDVPVADDDAGSTPTPSSSDDDGDSDSDSGSSGRGSSDDSGDDSDDDSGGSDDSSGSDDPTPTSTAPAAPQPTSTPVLVDDTTTGTVTDSDGASFAAVARTAVEAGSGRELWILVGRSLATVDGTISTVVGLLAAAVPLLLIVLAVTIWFVVGRALRPVDRMRQQVDEVTASSLDRRVADPGTDDEVGRLAHTMNRMLQRLDDSRRSQNRFISDASHELKSPLASLRQYAEVARAHPDRISPDELSTAVLDEGARLEGLVQGMLVLAKADERMLTRPATPVDLDDIVFAEAKRLRGSTSLTVDSGAVGAAQLHGDATLLSQLVRNLVDNAARHATTTVSLAVRVDADGTVALVVDDDGAGVPEADRDRVFERFVRLDEARARDGGGSGLGLAIVREIAAAHGGTVAVERGAGGGARFVVRLSTS
ncbi:HAMP domain-containing sensor histidine kinase [Agreia sp. PsM10]|uniref:sensor histidine kinase n=1 Tax=Agreia sp. PsM10 TaxID=3030533 RepID=UPI00263A87A6|nr:HAMP domain-containing sensor histidine kinase [Agreia sp. PsM10]MDN4641719.1 HAMP domain-containing sensor histidine kinase [Agreia sp. PsM10]